MADLNNILGNKSNTTLFKIRTYFSISIGIFLFVLFFQPFNIQYFTSNNQLLIIGGFASIIFLLLMFFLLAVPKIFPKPFKKNNVSADIFIHALMFVLQTVASVFFIRYVGKVNATFFMVVKTTLICAIPLVVLRIQAKHQLLIDHLRLLVNERKELVGRINVNESKEIPVIEINSEQKNETLKLKLSDIILVNSADNYVNIQYKNGDKIEKKIIRNTLKNIELLLKNYPEIIRCHRTYIINTSYVSKLSMSYKGYRLKMNFVEDEIPVSRQYLLSVKDKIGVA